METRNTLYFDQCNYSRAGRVDWKRGTIKIAGVENAGVENAAPSSRGGKRGTRWQGWETREWKMWHQVQGRIQDFKSEDGSPPVESRGKTQVGSRRTAPWSSSLFVYESINAIAQRRWYCYSLYVRPSLCLSVRLSVRLNVTLWYCIKTNKVGVMISSLAKNASYAMGTYNKYRLKFDRGHLEQGRFMRLGWVQTGSASKASIHLMGWRVLAFRPCSDLHSYACTVSRNNVAQGL